MFKPFLKHSAKTALALTVCVLASTSVLSLTGCNQGASPNEMVLKVNDTVISKEKLDEKTNQMMAIMNVSQMSTNDEQTQSLKAIFDQMAAESLILDTLVAQTAKQQNLTISDEELLKAYDGHVKKFGNPDTFQEYLKQLNITEADFKNQLKTELLKDKLISGLAGDKVVVSETQALKYYNDNPEQFTVPEQVRARHILIKLDADSLIEEYKKAHPKATDEELKKHIQAKADEKKQIAQSLLEQVIKDPAQFETLAKSKSDDKISGKDGGDLGYFSKDQMVPTFAIIAFQTKPGTIHPSLVKTRFGYHIIQVLDKKAQEKQAFDAVKQPLVQQMSQQLKMTELKNWYETQKKQADIELGENYQDLLTPEPSAIAPEVPAEAESKPADKTPTKP